MTRRFSCVSMPRGGLGLLLLVVGCESADNRQSMRPEGTLPVRYESAEDYSTCLVASVCMTGNYILGRRALTEPSMRAALRRSGLDETRVGDVRQHLQENGLHLIALREANIEDKPPLGLKYWLQRRGYPVICVINRDPQADPAFNHAVVIIGISPSAEDESSDIIHYFDPSSAAQLHSDARAVFEGLWDRCDRAMLLVVQPPKDLPDDSGIKESS